MRLMILYYIEFNEGSTRITIKSCGADTCVLQNSLILFGCTVFSLISVLHLHYNFKSCQILFCTVYYSIGGGAFRTIGLATATPNLSHN